ncbi:Uncharacterized membrane protein [Clostridium amylolyticum]|uniref:Uncharacterized membrane protein n=1 Tax=Clostridium amylolyticum TaxID=1121298 RepID=A0A1M6FD48_9CLOT|nr:DUF2207 domain-containing protein [Clostridium amylolyticum]SHI95592.1 Uncharacterized membrane protein [Clostridium amylolyticum]
MKKLIKALITALVFIFMFSVNVFAADKSFSVDGLNIEATLRDDASLDIVEDLNYKFTGDFNGVTRDLRLKGAQGYEIKKVLIKESSGDFKEIPQGENNNQYTIINNGSNGITIKIFSKSKNEKKIFRIIYNIKGAATLYDDTGELSWNFYSNDNKISVNNISLKILLPSEDLTDVKFWGHGPLYGKSEKIDNKHLLFTTPNLHNGAFIEARVIFSREFISKSTNVVKENRRDLILAEEKDRADRSNKEREDARKIAAKNEENARRVRKMLPVFFGAIALGIITILGFIINSNKKYKQALNAYRSQYPLFQGKYYRELPSDYPPAFAAEIIYSDLDDNTSIISATIMDMVRRKIITVVESEEVTGIIRKTTKKDYGFKVDFDKLEKSGYSFEKELVRWLLKYSSDKSIISFKEIKKKTKSESKARDFKDEFESWTSVIEEEIHHKLDPYTLIPEYKGSRGPVLKNEYEDHRLKWLALKNFLNDFSKLNVAEIPSIQLWEHFLVYGIMLGVSEKVINEMKLHIRPEDLTNDHILLRYMIMDSYFSTNLNTTEEILTKTMDIANSSNTDSSGSIGGGFSGGGSIGGGGGGSGAF